MTSVNSIILLVGALLLLGIGSSKFASRLGMPVLVLFLAVGMIAGSEGIGGIAFENYGFANSVGSVALALILYDGGLRTPLASVRSAWKPALSLSTVGVLLTSAMTGLAAAWILGLPILYGMLLGGIVGSTDAAAVFSVLRTSGIRLPDRLASTLEVESGSNDPMAIFLTLGLTAVILGTAGSPESLALLFILQFGVGTLAGVAIGKIAEWSVNRINLDHAGLYPILVLAYGLLAFGVAAGLGGSGFLAVYVAGIVLGNSTIVFRRGIFLFHDAAAWLGQIVLFVMLGLLSFPSRLLDVAGEGLLIALVLIFIARPLAVLVSVTPFGFNLRESFFLSWVGLKGAVPITLATFPLMAGVAESGVIFNAVFFVVLVSAIMQGWSLPAVARRLGLGRPADPAPPLSVEINALRSVDGDVVDYTVVAGARVAGRMLRDLALPDGALIVLVLRDNELTMPRGSTVLRQGDHVFLAMRSWLKPHIDPLFQPEAEAPLEPGLALTFSTTALAGEVYPYFRLPPPGDPRTSLGSLLQAEPEGPVRFRPETDPDLVSVVYLPSLVHAQDDGDVELWNPDMDQPHPPAAQADSGSSSSLPPVDRE